MLSPKAILLQKENTKKVHFQPPPPRTMNKGTEKAQLYVNQVRQCSDLFLHLHTFFDQLWALGNQLISPLLPYWIIRPANQQTRSTKTNQPTSCRLNTTSNLISNLRTPRGSSHFFLSFLYSLSTYRYISRPAWNLSSRWQQTMKRSNFFIS